MIDQELLQILRCPETRQAIKPADDALVDRLNRQIQSGQLLNRSGQPVAEKLDGGLIRADGKYLYAIRQNIPIMLIDEAIPLAS